MATLPLFTITSSIRRSSTCTLTHYHHRNPTCLRCCSSRDPEDQEKNKQGVKREGEEEKKKKVMTVGMRLFMGAEKVRESLRPKHKGDWKDAALMSLSFAVYIYMSQRIVCAYCAWMDMLHQGF